MLISNPLNHELFQPLCLSFSALLFLGLLGILLAGFRLKDAAQMQVLLRRWFSWLIIAIVLIAFVLSGALSLAMLTLAVCLVCISEFCVLTKRQPGERFVLHLSALAMIPAALFAANLLPLFFFLFFLLLVGLGLRSSRDFAWMAVSLAALLYIPLLGCHAVLLYQSNPGGPALLLGVVSASAFANIFAFLFGKILQGPKLAPEISPNKTRWGVLGAFAGSYFGFSVIAALSGPLLPFWCSFLVPAVVAAAGVIGDLFESILKRSWQVKDAGTWLPGFGGALDRVDGLLFVLPAVYYLLLPLQTGSFQL